MPSKYVLRCVENHIFEILEAIAKAEPIRTYELPDVSGFAYSICHYAMSQHLLPSGLISRLGGIARMTERGRIVLAIHLGKQHRKRSQWRAAA